MQIAVYILYELVIRLQELNPAIGEYVSFKKVEDGILIRTSTGQISVSDHILALQFNDPTAIGQPEILNLLNNFKLSTAE